MTNYRKSCCQPDVNPVRLTRRVGRLLPAFVLLVLAACGGPVDPPAALRAPLADAEAAYRIGPLDTLDVFVYGAPDLSVKVPVRPDGRISIPLVPDIPAVGKTPSELGKEIAARLAKYVNDPNVTVIVDSFNGPLNRSIRVIGQAVVPQTIPYTDGMTLLDVMVAVKGLTPFAAGNSAKIMRDVHGKEEAIPVKIGSLLNNGNMSQNVAMHPGDVVVIPESWF